MSDWLKPAATLGRDFALTPADAGWRYAGLQVVVLAPGEERVIHLTDFEAGILPLSATQVRVAVDDEVFVLDGRVGVFARVSDWVYAPVGSRVSISCPDGGEVSVSTAVAENRYPAAHVPASQADVAIRGAGGATRQVTTYAGPDNFPDAHRLLFCEILTPDGNWSSYPPHRHDGIGDCPHTNEEIYYFRIGRVGSEHGDPEGIGLHGTYTADSDPGEPVDFRVEVRDGDVAIVPRGYHGPCVAAPGYPMYYLNVLAGPNPRSYGFCDDPVHHWVRDSWSTMTTDPRVPMTSANGVVR